MLQLTKARWNNLMGALQVNCWSHMAEERVMYEGVFTCLGGGAQHRRTGGYHPPLWLKLLHCCRGLIRNANSCFLCRGVGSSVLSHVLEEIFFVCLFLQCRRFCILCCTTYTALLCFLPGGFLLWVERNSISECQA